MKMENLNKTQIVLLTLLTSFVTSIATGIVTVTLMDQAPAGVTQTINRVVERTIETITPGENQVTTVVKEVIIKEEDLIANAVEKSSKSLVRINAIDGEGTEVSLGLGVILSRDGYIVTDKNRIAGNRNNIIVAYGGESLETDVVLGEDDKVVILKIRLPENEQGGSENLEENEILELVPASLIDSESVKLGKVVVSFGGEMGDTIQTGIVSRLEKEPVNTEDKDGEILEEEKLSYIVTNIDINKKNAGGPLFDTDGNVLGINVVSSDGRVYSAPINEIKELLFSIISVAKEEVKEGGLTQAE